VTEIIYTDDGMSRTASATDGSHGDDAIASPAQPSPVRDSARSSPRSTPSKSPEIPKRPSARIIAMLNQKGGVGKTTTTVNLGAALAEAGQRVCLIDLDPQAHLTLHLGIDPQEVPRTVYDLLVDPDCYASEALINARANLDVILSETDLAAAETELANEPDRQSILRRKFGSLAEAYDVVIIDCPPSLGLLTLNALSLAREVFVPMQAHFLALQGVGKLLETVGLVCQSINPDLRVGAIVLCMHEQQTTLAREIVTDLDSFFAEASTQNVPWRNCRVLRPAIRRNVKLAEAPSFGKTIFDYEPTCPGAQDYRMLARQVLGVAETASAHPAELAAPTAAHPKAATATKVPAAASGTSAIIESKPQAAAALATKVTAAAAPPAAWATPASIASIPEIIVPPRPQTLAARRNSSIS
jgi:chromosome partitioning protein